MGFLCGVLVYFGYLLFLEICVFIYVPRSSKKNLLLFWKEELNILLWQQISFFKNEINNKLTGQTHFFFFHCTGPLKLNSIGVFTWFDIIISTCSGGVVCELNGGVGG